MYISDSLYSIVVKHIPSSSIPWLTVISWQEWLRQQVLHSDTESGWREQSYARHWSKLLCRKMRGPVLKNGSAQLICWSRILSCKQFWSIICPAICNCLLLVIAFFLRRTEAKDKEEQVMQVLYLVAVDSLIWLVSTLQGMCTGAPRIRFRHLQTF